MSYCVTRKPPLYGLEFWNEEIGEWTMRSNATKYATEGQAWDVMAGCKENVEADSEKALKARMAAIGILKVEEHAA